MRLARYARWLPPVLAIGGFAFVSATDLCRSPGTWIGPPPVTCDIDFLGMTLSTQAAGWLAAGIGGVLGTVLALILTGETARWTWPSVRRSIARGGPIIVGVTFVLVGVVVALSRIDFNRPPPIPRPAKQWTVMPAQTLRVPADQTQPGDSWACPDGQGFGVTPLPGQQVGIPGVFSIKLDDSGNVTAHCLPVPPLND